MYFHISFCSNFESSSTPYYSYSSHSHSFGMLYGSTWQYQQQSSLPGLGIAIKALSMIYKKVFTVLSAPMLTRVRMVISVGEL